MHPRDALEWGEPSNGLLCALWPLTQTVVVPEGLRPQQVAVFLEVIPRNRGDGVLRRPRATRPMSMPKGEAK